VPNADWIAEDRKGLTFNDATSAVFAMDIDWPKVDVTTYSWQKVMKDLTATTSSSSFPFVVMVCGCAHLFSRASLSSDIPVISFCFFLFNMFSFLLRVRATTPAASF
jgi:hypothetical protein